MPAGSLLFQPRRIADLLALALALKVGDTTRVEVERAGRRLTVTAVAAGQLRPFVTLEEMPGATDRARALRTAWAAGRQVTDGR